MRTTHLLVALFLCCALGGAVALAAAEPVAERAAGPLTATVVDPTNTTAEDSPETTTLDSAVTTVAESATTASENVTTATDLVTTAVETVTSANSTTDDVTVDVTTTVTDSTASTDSTADLTDATNQTVTTDADTTTTPTTAAEETADAVGEAGDDVDSARNSTAPGDGSSADTAVSNLSSSVPLDSQTRAGSEFPPETVDGSAGNDSVATPENERTATGAETTAASGGNDAGSGGAGANEAGDGSDAERWESESGSGSGQSASDADGSASDRSASDSDRQSAEGGGDPAPVPVGGTTVTVGLGALAAGTLVHHFSEGATFVGNSGVASSSAATLSTTASGTKAAVRSRFDDAWRLVAPFRYSSYDDSDPLDHETRDALYGAIERDPGTYLSELTDRTDVPVSTAQHHLDVLVSEGLAVAAKVRGKRRFYPAHADDVELTAALEDDGTAAVLRVLARLGDSHGGRIADELDRDPSTVSHHLSRLEDAGLLEREREGRAVVNRLTPAVKTTLRGRPETDADGDARSGTAD